MSVEDLVSALSRAPLFRDVEAQQLRLLAFSGVPRNLSDGETLMTRGDAYAPAALIVEGEVTVDAGHGIAGRAGPGSLLNAEGALAGKPAPATIRAAAPSRVLLIERELIVRVIGEYPVMGRAMLRTLGGDLRTLARRVRVAGAQALDRTTGK